MPEGAHAQPLDRVRHDGRDRHELAWLKCPRPHRDLDGARRLRPRGSRRAERDRHNQKGREAGESLQWFFLVRGTATYRVLARTRCPVPLSLARMLWKSPSAPRVDV